MAKIVATSVKIYAESLDEFNQLVADAESKTTVSNIVQNSGDGSFGSITIDIDELGA